MFKRKDSYPRGLSRREFIETSAAAALCGLSGVEGLSALASPPQESRRQAMRAVPDSAKVDIARDDKWYQAFTGVAVSKNVVVCSYLKTDQHLRNTTDIMIARSEDGGRTWEEHKSIAHSDVDHDGKIWVAPELNRLRDGRLALLCDLGARKPGENLPMLSQWQTRERGMWNYMFISDDQGGSWSGPQKVDDVGGEPSRPHELSNGVWMYTRTDSSPTTAMKVPTAPWGPMYYRNTAVFSDDKGKTFSRTSKLVDDPLMGDCEVDLVEFSSGKILAITRVGDGGGRYGQPSRFVYSDDYGKTWSKPILSPIYGQRPIPGLLKSGKVLVSFRNTQGTSGSYAFVFDPKEKFSYEPNSFIWDESRCQLKEGVMELKTAEGSRNAAQFTLYPVEDDDSSIEMEFQLAVKEADKEGCLVSAGAWVRFEPNRVSLADRESEGFAIDATKFHTYRLVNRGHKFSIYVDGKLKLETPTEGIFTRLVRFGNRPGARPAQLMDSAAAAAKNGYLAGKTGNASDKYERTPLRGTQYFQNTSHTLWRSISARITNRRDHSIDWRWNARQGFPDQLRRDRMIRLDYNGSFAAGDSGYSGWTQMDDGRIVIVDYTTGPEGNLPPFVRAYLVREQDLI